MANQKPIHPNDGSKCPQWQKPRHKVCHECAWYILVRGKHPQTNADVDTWDCAIALMPMLSIENAMVNRQTTATVDALRKEVAEANDVAMVGTLHRLNSKIDETRQISANQLSTTIGGDAGALMPTVMPKLLG